MLKRSPGKDLTAMLCLQVIEDGDQGMLLVSEHMNGISLAQSCYESKPCICEAAARRYMIKMIEVC